MKIKAEALYEENKAPTSTLYCPRCNRAYTKGPGELYSDLLDRVKYHVAHQHPDHDPNWWDTYPDPEKSEPFVRTKKPLP